MDSLRCVTIQTGNHFQTSVAFIPIRSKFHIYVNFLEDEFLGIAPKFRKREKISYKKVCTARSKLLFYCSLNLAFFFFLLTFDSNIHY